VVANARAKHARGPRHVSQPRRARHAGNARARKHASAGSQLSWAKIGPSGIAAVVMVWAVTSALGSHSGHAQRSAALASALDSSSNLSASSTVGATPVDALAMPVVPGLAQAAIRQPASVSYATMAWAGRATPHVSGVAAEPASLQVTTIPRLASISYQRAASTQAHDAPTCGLSWEILAGIGLVESDHGRGGGAGNQRWSGIASPAILGPLLNGQDGFPVIKDTDHGVLDANLSFDRAVGPMQFLPATWREYNPVTSGAAAPNPENISDAAFAAARYLCASDVDLRTPTGLIDALYGYNHSFAYVMNVVTAAQRYAEGTLRGASGALAVLPALLSGQPTASFLTDPVALPSGSTSPSTAPATSGTSPDNSPDTTLSPIVTFTPTEPGTTSDPTPAPIPQPTDTSPSESTQPSDSPDPDSSGADSPTPDSSSPSSPETDSPAPTSASYSPLPDTSAPDSASPTPSLAPTPSLTPTPSLAPTPSVAPTQSSTPTPTPPPASPTTSDGSTEPGPANTGVPAGTQLTVYNGDLTITTPGATYADLDIYGFVRVEAPDVTIKNSIIRGGPATSNTAIIYDLSDAATNLLVEDSEIVPADPSVFIDGIDGWNYTALRLNIHGTVDGAKMFGPNATMEDSWIHDLVTYQNDPSHADGVSHNDDVQVLSGSNLRIIGNDLEGGHNTAIQLSQDNGPLTDILIDSNWADAGNVTFNIANKPLASLAGVTVTNNIFGHAAVTGCQILYTSVTSIVASNNVFADTGLPVVILNTGSITGT
jgi:membrane-bound lytic murein transglycosylase B